MSRNLVIAPCTALLMIFFSQFLAATAETDSQVATKTWEQFIQFSAQVNQELIALQRAQIPFRYTKTFEKSKLGYTIYRNHNFVATQHSQEKGMEVLASNDPLIEKHHTYDIMRFLQIEAPPKDSTIEVREWKQPLSFHDVDAWLFHFKVITKSTQSLEERYYFDRNTGFLLQHERDFFYNGTHSSTSIDTISDLQLKIDLPDSFFAPALKKQYDEVLKVMYLLFLAWGLPLLILVLCAAFFTYLVWVRRQPLSRRQIFAVLTINMLWPLVTLLLGILATSGYFTLILFKLVESIFPYNSRQSYTVLIMIVTISMHCVFSLVLINPLIRRFLR